MRLLPPLLVLTFAACSGGTGPGPSDGGSMDHQPTSAELFGKGITAVTLELDYQQGAAPYTGTTTLGGDTFDLFKANAAKLFEGQGKTITVPSQLSQMEQLTDVSGADFTGAQILAIAKAHRGSPSKGATATFYVVWLAGYLRDENNAVRMDVLGVSLGDTGVIAMFKPVIDSTKSLVAPNQARFVEQSTLVHEFGHAVGLVNNGVPLATAHQDTAHGAHCTNTKCTMYYANEGATDVQSWVAQNVTTGTQVLFGSECLQDVAAIRK